MLQYDMQHTPPPILFLSKSTKMLPMVLILILLSFSITAIGKEFSIKEATIHDIQIAFKQNRLTSKQLVEFYLKEIQRLNPVLKSVIEVNPDAIHLAEKADQEREAKRGNGSLFGLHGIPILLKDNIATKDKLNTTAGSYALLGSVVPRDAGVVKKLREAGAIIIGKASLTEWASFRTYNAPSGWSARGGQPLNPYVASSGTCGSSSGSAVSVAANMAAVSLGTETDGSILCPAHANSVVGIKPTVGLTSRAGVVPITHRQDTVGPICRTVADAVLVLDAIVGFDDNDATATREASKYIPKGGYSRFLKSDGLKGKRLGFAGDYPYFGFPGKIEYFYFEKQFEALWKSGAILVHNLEIANMSELIITFGSETKAMEVEFKMDLNAYLKQLVASPVRSLADVIAFNKKYTKLEKVKEYDQSILLEAEKTNGIGELEKNILQNLTRASKYGFEKLMKDYKLDALVTPFADGTSVLAIGGYPGISVPAGYDEDGTPYGICFGGLKGSEPTLIEIAYGFDQATKSRKPPPV